MGGHPGAAAMMTPGAESAGLGDMLRGAVGAAPMGSMGSLASSTMGGKVGGGPFASALPPTGKGGSGAVPPGYLATGQPYFGVYGGDLQSSGAATGPAVDPFADFRNVSDMKIDHVPNAPDVLRAIGVSGRNARGYVETTYQYLQGGQMYVNLCAHASVLDTRLRQLAGMPRVVKEQDPIVEMACSELAAQNYFLISGDAVGEAEIRAVSGTDSYLASAKVRARAIAAAKDASKMATYLTDQQKRGRGRGRGRRFPAMQDNETKDKDKDKTGDADDKRGQGRGRGGPQ